MQSGRRHFPRLIVAVLLILSAGRASAAEAVAQKAIVFGTATANLRVGAGMEHALKLTLKEGDPVTIEKLEGEWFFVTAADGQKGYIHKNLLKLVDNAAAQPQVVLPQKSIAVTAPVTGSAQTVTTPPLTPVAPARGGANAKTTDGKAPSLLQMLEAHESEVKIGVLVAAVAFVIGWFCGGHYYIRREQKHRRRLRL